jgi:hypothetical protein
MAGANMGLHPPGLLRRAWARVVLIEPLAG